MGKQLIIVGADFSAVAIGTAKVLVSIAATISGTQYTNSTPTGITVTATWDDQSTSTVSGWTTSPSAWGDTVGQQTMTISYTRGGVTKTTTVTANVQQGSGTMYTVTANITNGTAASVSVASGGTATLMVTPASGYNNPTSVSVSSGTCGTPTINGATITVPNVTSNVVLAATCPQQAGSTYTITPTIAHGIYGGATTMNANDSLTVVIAAITDYKLPSSITVSGATYTYNSYSGAIHLTNPTGNITIDAECISDASTWTQQPLSLESSAWGNATVGTSGPQATTNLKRLYYTTVLTPPATSAIKVTGNTTASNNYEVAFRVGDSTYISSTPTYPVNEYWMNLNQPTRISGREAYYLIFRKIPSTLVHTNPVGAISTTGGSGQEQEFSNASDLAALQPALYYGSNAHTFDATGWYAYHTPNLDSNKWKQAGAGESGISAKTTRLTYDTVYSLPTGAQYTGISVTCGFGYQWGLRIGASDEALSLNTYWFNSGDQYVLTSPTQVFRITFRKTLSGQEYDTSHANTSTNQQTTNLTTDVPACAYTLWLNATDPGNPNHTVFVET